MIQNQIWPFCLRPLTPRFFTPPHTVSDPEYRRIGSGTPSYRIGYISVGCRPFQQMRIILRLYSFGLECSRVFGAPGAQSQHRTTQQSLRVVFEGNFKEHNMVYKTILINLPHHHACYCYLTTRAQVCRSVSRLSLVLVVHVEVVPR